MADQPANLAPDQELANPSPHKKKINHKWLILICAFILFSGAAIGSILYFAPGFIPSSLRLGGMKDPSQKSEESTRKTQGHIYGMDPFLVNLADADQPRYLKIRIDIESDIPKANEEYEKRLPQLRDTILILLSSKTHRGIFDSDGKKKLKEEMIARLNGLVKNFKVKTVYFTEFVIQ